MDQNKKSKKIKGTNVLLEEIIKTIWRVNKIVKKREDLKGYWPHDDFGDKELKFKYFKNHISQVLEYHRKFKKTR